MEVTPKILVTSDSVSESSITPKILVTSDSVSESTITPKILVISNPVGDSAKITNLKEYIVIDKDLDVAIIDNIQEEFVIDESSDIKISQKINTEESIVSNININFNISENINISKSYNTKLSYKKDISLMYNTIEEKDYSINEIYRTINSISLSNTDISYDTILILSKKYSTKSNVSLDYENNIFNGYNTSLYEKQIKSIDSDISLSIEEKYDKNYNTDLTIQKTYEINQNNNTKISVYSKVINYSDIDLTISKYINKTYNTSEENNYNENTNYNTECDLYSVVSENINTSENISKEFSLLCSTNLSTTSTSYSIYDNYYTKAGIRSKLNQGYNTFVLLNIKEEDDEDMSADVLVNLYVDNQRIVDTCKNLIDKTGVTISSQSRNSKSYNVIDMTNDSHTGILIKNDLDITNESFTIGYWAKSADTENVSNICVDIESADLAVKMQVENSEVLKGTTYSAGYEITDDVLRLNLALLDQAWHYITYCRVKNNYTATTENDSDSLLVFIDGKKILTVPMNTDENFDNKKFTIGYNADADKRFIGYIDDYILVKNTVLHEVDFTTTPDTYLTKTVRDTILNTTTKSFKSVGTSASDVTVNQRNDSDTIDILSLHNTFNIVNN